MLNVYEQVDQNKRRSALIIIFFILFVVGVTWLIGTALDFGASGVGMALVISGIMSFTSYYWSDKVILAISGARPANKKKDFLFYSVAENLSLASHIPMPKLYVIEDTAMNAFATGRDPEHAAVCATTGLLARLNRTELEGVIAHEMSHIRNYDIRLMSIVTVLVGLVTLLADWLLRSMRWGGGRRNKNENSYAAVIMIVAIFLALLSPLIANLIKLALSRRREYLADADAIKITRQPSGLINALKKLGADREPLEAANKATAHLYIVNPLRNLHSGIGWFSNLFNTHPPLKERIKMLEKMS